MLAPISVRRQRLQHGSIAGIEKPVSRIIYGTLFLHNLPTEEAAYELLDGVWAAGCNALDCAAIYGGGVCEKRVGGWLKSRRIPRDEIVIISKGGCEGQDKLWSATIADHEHMRREVANSLSRLGVEYLDCYLLHRDDPSLPVGQIVDFMHEMCASGAIHSWGVSNWQLPRLRAALDYAREHGKRPPVADSPQESLAEPSRAVWPNTSFMTSAKRPQWLAATGGAVALLGWECLAKGFMCGKWERADGEFHPDDDIQLCDENAPRWRELQLRIAYCNADNFDRRDRAAELAREKGASLPEIALGYVISQQPRSFALVGTTNLVHFEQNVRAARVGSPVACLTREELAYMETGVPRRKPPAGNKRSMGSVHPGAILALLAGLLAVGAMQSTARSAEVVPDGALRFSGASTDAGTVEIFHSGTWGSICAAPDRTRGVAAVACRQLGFGLATGTMLMPVPSGEDQAGRTWLASVSCSGSEASLMECNHPGWGVIDSACTSALGVRCLACTGDQCNSYAAELRLTGAVLDPSLLKEEFYRGSAVRLECHRTESGSRDTSVVDCDVRKFALIPPSPLAVVDDPQLEEHLLAGLPDPFRDEARNVYHFGALLAKEYAARRRAMMRYLADNPADSAALRDLVRVGALKWNDVGIRRQPLLKAINSSNRLFGLIRRFYLSPRVQIVADLDGRAALPLGHSADAHPAPGGVSVADAAAHAIAGELMREGLAVIDDYGLDIEALNATIDRAFSERNLSVTSVASNGASMATRVALHALGPLLRNTTINTAVKAYLGADAVLDGYKVVRLAAHAAAADNIAGLWHNDRAGHRLKLFVRLHDVDPRPSAGAHPTLVARGSHELLHYSFEGYEHSRYTDAFVRSEYSIATLGGKMGGGFIFDTNTIHKAVPQGLRGRTTIVLEYHSAAKCPVVQQLDLPIPCPSGDQRLFLESERKLVEQSTSATDTAPQSAEVAVEPGLPAYRVANLCVAWVAEVSETERIVHLPESAFLNAKHEEVHFTGRMPLPYALGARAHASMAAAVLVVRDNCEALWRRYSYDVMPLDGNTVWWDEMGSEAIRHGLCVYEGKLGYVPFHGPHAGGCVTPDGADPSFGNFDMLLAFPNFQQASRAAPQKWYPQRRDDESTFRALVAEYISSEDARSLTSITGVPLHELVDDVAAAGDAVIEALQRTPLMAAVLSAARFVPHPLNSKGLHLLRVVLAERMTDRRRDAGEYGEEALRLRDDWLRRGFLRLDFSKYVSSQGHGNALLDDLLRMTSASSGPTSTLEFVEREIVHVEHDPQYALHVDTFHPVIKVWVYDRNVTLDSGPMHYVPGSHRSTTGKLSWLFQRTRDNSEDIVKEPSLRFDSDNTPAVQASEKLVSSGLATAEPVLPLEEVARTLIIADTSGLHCRGIAPAGVSRPQLRPMGAQNDGGVKRFNPFRGDHFA